MARQSGSSWRDGISWGSGLEPQMKFSPLQALCARDKPEGFALSRPARLWLLRKGEFKFTRVVLQMFLTPIYLLLRGLPSYNLFENRGLIWRSNQVQNQLLIQQGSLINVDVTIKVPLEILQN